MLKERKEVGVKEKNRKERSKKRRNEESMKYKGGRRDKMKQEKEGREGIKKRWERGRKKETHEAGNKTPPESEYMVAVRVRGKALRAYGDLARMLQLFSTILYEKTDM